MWYNYKTNEIEFLDTTVVDENTISAQVDHFSTYGVIDRSWFFDDICWNNDIDLTKKGRADIVFAIDTTSSMSGTIIKVKQYVNKFASGLENKDVNYRFGLVEYRDIYEDGVNTTVNHGWYNDADSFKTAISNLSVSGGGDFEESAVDALYTARSMRYRPSVNKYIVLITDAPYKNGIRNYPNHTMDDEIKELSKYNFCVSIVSNGYSQYNKLINTTKGISATINSDFSTSLNGLISKIGTETQGGYWIRLSNGSVVKLDKNPNDGDKKFDTDKDGIPDLSELKKKTIKRVYNPITKKIEDVETWTFKSNPSKPDSDGDGLNDNSDVNPTEFDIRLVKNTPQLLSFNTGNIWFKIEGTAQDIFSKQCNGAKVDDSSFYNDLNTIYDLNAKKDFSLYELCCIGLLDNEGSKFYLENESTSTRDKIFKTLCSRETHYYAHSGIGNDVDDWEQVNSYNDGHWYGKVLSESDINFSLKPFYKIDLLDCIPAIITLGIIVIVAVVVIYATPVIVANITALCEACSAFGIKQGLALYMTFGAEGVISFIEADMADGDSSIDDILEIGVKSSDNCVSLYRAVSEAEYNDFIAKNNRFDYFPNAMESKWFAVNKSDCYVWADKFYNNECFKVIQINIPEIYLQVDELDIIYNPFLDAIGPAYCIHIEKINEILSKILGD